MLAVSFVPDPEGQANPQARHTGLEREAVRGIRWTFLAYAGTRMLGVAAMLVLARLLVPRDFGLVAFAALVIQLVVHFTGLGLGPALVIRPGLGRRALGTIETSMLVLGPFSAAIVLALSPIAAGLIGDRRLVGVLAVLTIPVAFSGVTSFYGALLQRELAFRALSACLLAQAAAAAVVSVGVALLDGGVLEHRRRPGRRRGRLRGRSDRAQSVHRPPVLRARSRTPPRSQRARVRSPRRVLVHRAEPRLRGRRQRQRSEGARRYSLAYRLSELPSNAIVEPVAQVTFPGFARMKHRREDVSDTFLTVLRTVAVVGCPIAVLLAAAAEPFVRAVLGEKWLPTVGPLSVLGLWGAVRIVQATLAWMLNSLGLALALGRAYAVLVAATAPFLVVAATRSGLTAVSFVMLGNVIVTLTIALYLAVRTVGLSGARIWAALRPVVLAAAPAWVVTRALAEGVDLRAAPLLVMSVAAGALTYVLVLILAGRGVVKDVARQAAQVWSPVVVGEAPAGDDSR